MAKNENMLSTVTPWDMVAQGYAETSMMMLQAYTERAINLLKIDPTSKILDVACGPGTLSLEISKKVDSVYAIDFSPEMLTIFKNKLNEHGIINVDVCCGDGQDLPYEDERFDAAFSMFGLMFFPERNKGFSELYRTVKPGGQIAVSSWAPVGKSPAMQIMFGAIRAMKPEIPEPQTDIASLENPEVFHKEMQAVGFKNIDVHLVSIDFPVESVEKFWSNMVNGSAPIVMMKNSMSPEEWSEKEKIALAYLHENVTSVPTSLSSDAWIACAEK